MGLSAQQLAERVAGRLMAAEPLMLRRHLAAAALSVDLDLADEHDSGATVSGSGIATVHVSGVLFSRGDWFTRAMGWADHEGLSAVLGALASDQRVKGVLLSIDSPGGDCAGMLEACEKVAQLAEAKPVYAVANHHAYSAAYALASAASRVYVSQAGGVGSIGVVTAHVDQSQRDAQTGYRITFLHHGAKKVDANAHEPLSERARADIRADIDTLGEAFAARVAKGRGLKAADVIAMEAGTFMGAAAVEAGLADQVGTLSQARADLAKAINAKANPFTFAESRARRAAFTWRSA